VLKCICAKKTALKKENYSKNSLKKSTALKKQHLKKRTTAETAEKRALR